MPPTAPRPPEWPIEVARLHALLQEARGAGREAARAALWSLLVGALAGALRGHARRAGESDPVALEDIASEKALELLARAESGAWDAAGRSPGEIVRYVAQTAHNGWLDHQARSRREVSMNREDGFDAEQEMSDVALATAGGAAPEESVIARELAGALQACVERLPERDRRVWFFRAYYEMSSRDIATHPDVGLRVGHVDVVNQRARDALRACMHGKGHDLVDIPRAAFVELWEVIAGLAPRMGAVDAPRTTMRRWP